MVDPEVLEQLREVPTALFAERFLYVVDEGGARILLKSRPAQEKLETALAAQVAAGLPQRAIVLKSRKTGISTYVQAKILHRAISKPHTLAVVVAQDNDTAAALFTIGKRMYDHLADALRPDLVSVAQPAGGGRVMHFGVKGRGLGSPPDSRILTGSAKEVSSGRGKSPTDLHLSEAAHWDSFGDKGAKIGEMKALGLLNSVADDPGTLIVIESTANGYDWFHAHWQDAVSGANGYAAVFIGWPEDPQCTRRFIGTADDSPEEQREKFIQSIGTGPWGEDEPNLVENYGCTPEQLYWRRTAIPAKCQGKLEYFAQEYPKVPEEAFIGSSRQVFSVIFTGQAVQEAKAWEERPPQDGGPQRGLFRATAHQTRELLDGVVQVPTAVEWVPQGQLSGRVEWWPGYFWEKRDPLWTVWFDRGSWPGNEWTPQQWREAQVRGEVTVEQMDAGMTRRNGPGQFVIGGDPADDIENNSFNERHTHAFNALVGVDYFTGCQVAEFEARMDHDLVARHAFLCGLFLNEAWLGIEATGGYGNSMLSLLNRRFYYRFLYRHRRLTTVKGEETTKLGWYTEKQSKQQMEATAQAMLREGTHGIRSPRLAGQLVTYIKDDRGRHGPSDGSFADLLMAWMQAQEIRRLKPPKTLGLPSEGPASSITRRFGG